MIKSSVWGRKTQETLLDMRAQTRSRRLVELELGFRITGKGVEEWQ